MKRQIDKYGFIFIFGAICLILIAVLYLYIVNSSLDFDGAYEGIAARYFADTGSYASVTYGKATIMDVGLSTGPTVIFPVALIFKLFGVSMAKALVVSVLYLFSFFILLFILGKQYFNKWLSLIFAVLFFVTPLLFNYGIGMLGEVPAAFFLVLSILAWVRLSKQSRYHIAWGIVFGACVYLAFLTKMICAILAAAIAVLLIIDFFLFHTIKKKDFTWIILGVFVVMFSFEIFKFVQLGCSFQAYKHWFRQALNGIIGLNKITPDSKGIQLSLKLIIDRTNVLISNSGSRLYIFSIISAFPLYFLYLVGKAIYKLKHGMKFKEYFKSLPIPMLVAGCGGYAFLLYWYFICLDSVLWYRRFYPGILLLTIFTNWLLVYIIYKTILAFKTNTKIYLKTCAAALSVVFTTVTIIALSQNIKNISVPTKPSFLLDGVTGVCNVVNDLPKDAEIYGVGFWEVPQIEFVTGRHVRNFDEDIKNGFPKTDGGHYIIVDYYYYNLDQSWENIEKSLYVTKIFEKNDYIIYKMNALNYKPGIK
jgi:hypothetical protein